MLTVSRARSITTVVQTVLQFALLWVLFTLLIVDRAQAKATFQNTPAIYAADQEVITVTGQNDPAQDLTALSAAISQASAGDTVVLEGVFDLSDCESGITLTKNITVTGASDPNEAPAEAAQIVGCGPAFIVNIPDVSAGALTIQNIYFRAQQILSIQFMNSVNPVVIRNNRFTGNIPLTLPAGMGRFAVGVAELGPLTIRNTITVEQNYIDWSDSVPADQFVGDDNGFAFATGNMSLVIRDNFINSLGEAIEIEGNLGQENSYLVEGNIIYTHVPTSAMGESSGPAGSVAEGIAGGHPAAIKVHANEGSFVVRNNEVTLSGLSPGVCMMATTLHSEALAGNLVHVIEHNKCTMAGQLAALLGAWGESQPFFDAASLSGTLVSGNVISGTGATGIAMVSRTEAPLLSSVVNDGHGNKFLFNDFSNFTATKADIGFDPQTSNNLVVAWPEDQIIDLGQNQILTQRILLPRIVIQE